MAKRNPTSTNDSPAGTRMPLQDRPQVTSVATAYPSRPPNTAPLRPRSRWGRPVGVRRTFLPNDKTPRRAASWAIPGVVRGLFGGELAPLRLLEPRVLALGVDLAQY